MPKGAACKLGSRLLVLFLAGLTIWLNGIPYSKNVDAKSYIEEDNPKKTNQAEMIVPIQSRPSLKKEKEAKLKIITALDYKPGQDKGTAYIEISSENAYISELDEMWLIHDSFARIKNVEAKARYGEKWKKIKNTVAEEVGIYGAEKLANIFTMDIADIALKLEKKEAREKKESLESVLDFDGNLTSLLKRAESFAYNTSVVSFKISFVKENKEIEVETRDGKFITGRYPSSRTIPDFYAVFSLQVRDKLNFSGGAKNVGMRWIADVEGQIEPAKKGPVYVYELKTICQNCGKISVYKIEKSPDFPLMCPYCKQHTCWELYKCHDCGYEFPVKPGQMVTTCPRCGSAKVGAAPVSK